MPLAVLHFLCASSAYAAVCMSRAGSLLSRLRLHGLSRQSVCVSLVEPRAETVHQHMRARLESCTSEEPHRGSADKAIFKVSPTGCIVEFSAKASNLNRNIVSEVVALDLGGFEYALSDVSSVGKGP